MANSKDPNQKQPGEKEPGKYHYNPGNMSGKTADSGKPKFERRANVDRIKSVLQEVTAAPADQQLQWLRARLRDQGRC